MRGHRSFTVTRTFLRFPFDSLLCSSPIYYLWDSFAPPSPTPSLYIFQSTILHLYTPFILTPKSHLKNCATTSCSTLNPCAPKVTEWQGEIKCFKFVWSVDALDSTYSEWNKGTMPHSTVSQKYNGLPSGMASQTNQSITKLFSFFKICPAVIASNWQ